MTGSYYLLRTCARHVPYRLRLCADDALVHGAAAACRVLGKAVGLMRRTQVQGAHENFGPAKFAFGSCFVCALVCSSLLQQAFMLHKVEHVRHICRLLSSHKLICAQKRCAHFMSIQKSTPQQGAKHFRTIYTVQTLSYGTNSLSSYSSDGGRLFSLYVTAISLSMLQLTSPSACIGR